MTLLQVRLPEAPHWKTIWSWPATEGMGPARDWLLSPLESYPAGTTVAVVLSLSTSYYLLDNSGEARVMPRIETHAAVPVNAWYETTSSNRLCQLIPEDLDRGSSLHRRLVQAALRTAYDVLPWWEDSNPSEKSVRAALDSTKRWVEGTDWHGAGAPFYAQVERAEYSLRCDDEDATAYMSVPPLPALEVLGCVLTVQNVIFHKKQADALRDVYDRAATAKCSAANPTTGPRPRQKSVKVRAQQADQLREIIPLREVLTEHAFRLPRLRETL